MGALTSRQNAGVEEVDVVSNHAYKYPPKSGNYFGSHFIMGGERFDTPQPEAYLFGENADLNFLGCRPTPFPYPPPQANEPTKTLKSLVNIRKESLRFVKTMPVSIGKTDTELKQPTQFNIEFTFDADTRCTITIYYFVTEDITPNGVVFTPKDPSLTSETFTYKRGANQLFCQPTHIFDPSGYSDEDLLFNSEKEIIPIAIHCVAQEGSDDTKQSHTTIAVVDRHTDGSYVIKALKQKIFVDGLCYLLQEIYGIENKNQEIIKGGSEVDTEDNGSECVICMCDVRDTLILPCRHLCLCNSCADSLRYQANNCPICRAPFRALLQIRALQKSSGIVSNHSTQPATTPASAPGLGVQGSGQPPADQGSCENIPAGYEGVSLIEALNGPCLRPVLLEPSPVVEGPQHDIPPHLLNRYSLERPKQGKEEASSPPEVRMSVLLAREEGSASKEKDKSPLLPNRRREKRHVRDSVKTVDETALNAEDDGVEEELDSEAEKLSPLLSGTSGGQDEGEEDEAAAPPTPGEEDVAEEVPAVGARAASPSPCPSGATPKPEGPPGEDSDYYTPEDPATTIFSPLHNLPSHEKEKGSEGTGGGRWISLPGTPLSNASHRSSGDSYSSSGSTRLLLSDRTTSLRSST